MSAAASRAAHLLVDGEPFIFEDRLAARLLDAQAEAMIPYHRASGSHPVLAGTQLVMDSVLTPELRDADGEIPAGFAKPVAAQSGEPWLSELTPDQPGRAACRGQASMSWSSAARKTRSTLRCGAGPTL